jgi:ribonuclease R
MEAEREVVDMYRAYLMRDRVGEEYDGTIAGVTSFGFFVQIESPFIEGLVKIDTLSDDFYELDERTQRLVGKRSGRAFALGDRVRVRVENVSVQRRKIDLVLEEHVSVTVDVRSEAPLGKARRRKRVENRQRETDRKRRSGKDDRRRGGRR